MSLIGLVFMSIQIILIVPAKDCNRVGVCCSNFELKGDRCIACNPGRSGVNCSNHCPDGFYGQDCRIKCPLECNKTCDKADDHCS